MNSVCLWIVSFLWLQDISYTGAEIPIYLIMAVLGESTTMVYNL